MGFGPSPRRNCTTSTNRSHRMVCTAKSVPSRPVDDRCEPKKSLSSSELVGVSMDPKSARAISPLALCSQKSASFHQHPTDGKPRDHSQTEQRSPRSLRAPGESSPGFCTADSSWVSDRVIVRQRTTDDESGPPVQRGPCLFLRLGGGGRGTPVFSRCRALCEGGVSQEYRIP